MSTHISSGLPPWGLSGYGSALPQLQRDLPIRKTTSLPSNLPQIDGSPETVQLAAFTTTPTPPRGLSLWLRPPHHDIAFEEEGWLQADTKLLGTRACNVTGEERRQS